MFFTFFQIRSCLTVPLARADVPNFSNMYIYANLVIQLRISNIVFFKKKD